MVYSSSKRLLAGVILLVALTASLVFSNIASAHPAGGRVVSATKARTIPLTTVNYYGATYGQTLAATQYWPQSEDNWCGIANVQAIELFDWAKYGGGAGFAPYPSEADIYTLMNSTGSGGTVDAESPWGTAIKETNPITGLKQSAYVKADIADDGGTDPRSIAWALWFVTPNGLYFHNYIYPGTVIVNNQEVNGNLAATANFAYDFGADGLNNPISVAINQGAHSMLVDGVYATDDPSENDGAGVTAIDTWDPLVGSSFPDDEPYNSTQDEVWSIDDWVSLTPPGTVNNGYLFGYPYSATASNGYDPDPNTDHQSSPASSPIYYNPQPAHWNTNFVTDEGDDVTACDADPNIAYNNVGLPVAHYGTTWCP